MKQGTNRNGLSSLLRGAAYAAATTAALALPGCMTQRDVTLRATDILLRKEANRLDVPLKADYVDEILKTYISADTDRTNPLFPGFVQRAESLKEKLADSDTDYVTFAPGNFSVKANGENTPFTVNIETGDVRVPVNQNGLRVNVLYDKDRTWPAAQQQTGNQPLVVADYMSDDGLDVIYRVETPLEGTAWKNDLGTLVVAHLRNDVNPARDIHQRVMTTAGTRPRALSAEDLARRLTYNGVSGKSVVDASNREFGSGTTYNFPENKHLTILVGTPGTTTLKTVLYGADRDTLLRVGAYSGDSMESGSSEIYELVTGRIPLTADPSGPAFNRGGATLVHTRLNDGKVAERTFYRVNNAQSYLAAVAGVFTGYRTATTPATPEPVAPESGDKKAAPGNKGKVLPKKKE